LTSDASKEAAMDKEQAFSILHSSGILTVKAGSSSLRLANYRTMIVVRSRCNSELDAR